MFPLLSIKNLTVTVGQKVLVNDVSLSVNKGRIVAIAGGSGSGKTTIGLSILRLLSPALRITAGSIQLEGQDLLSLSSQGMRQMRGARIGMVFQEPLSAFNPLFTIGTQIDEVLCAHTTLNAEQRYVKVLETLDKVELPEPRRIYNSYPHQISGGQRQRAMIAQAIVCNPSLVIADEPTSSLDVTVQAKIMDLFRRLKKDGMSIILIAHDLGMVSHLADEVVILKEGKVAESGDVRSVMDKPKHAYTKELIEAFQ